MISDMVTLGLRADPMSDEDLRPAPVRKESMRDITDLFYSRLFKRIPKSKTGQVIFISSLLIGWQGSGKSDTIAYDVYRCQQTYGRENVEIIHTNSYKTVLDRITGTKPVVFAIVDDAMKNQNSRKSMSSENADLVADYNETRHVFEKRSAGKILNAVIIVETAVQRWHGLDITMRSSSELIRFKTGETDKHDRETIRDYLGPEGLWNLDTVWNMALGNPKYKSFSIGRIANIQPPTGVGLCWNGYMPDIDPSFVLPPLIEANRGPESGRKVSEPSWTKEDPLSDLRNDPEWSYKILAWSLNSKGVTQDTIAATMESSHGIKVTRSAVSRWISAVKKILSERTSNDAGKAPPPETSRLEEVPR